MAPKVSRVSTQPPFKKCDSSFLLRCAFLEKALPVLQRFLRPSVRPSAAALGCPTSDFNVLLNAELRQGLFDAQCCQAGGSIRVPTLPHDFAHHPQSLEKQGRKPVKAQ